MYATSGGGPVHARVPIQAHTLISPKQSQLHIDRVSVPSPIVIDVLMDTMARDRAHMYLFSV